MVRSSVVVVLGLLVGTASAQQPPAGPPWANKLFLPDITQNPTQPPPPVLTHNFGAVPKGTLCTRTFTLTNIYDVPLQVIETNPGCKCLTAYPPQRILLPTESAEFTVTMDTRVLDPGPASRTLRVTVRAQEYQHTAVFRFEVDARADLMLTPGVLAFGTVGPGESKTASVVLDYQGRQPGWKITGVRPASGPLDVKVEDAGRGKYRLTATLRPTAAPGAFSDRVSLTTNDPALPVVQVPASGVVLAPVTVTPDAPVVFARPVKVGERDELAIILRGANQPFQVRPIADPGDGVSVEPFGFPGPVQRVVVRFQPTKPGAVRKELRLETDLPGRPAVTIRVEAVGE